jgi:hypothetical protein
VTLLGYIKSRLSIHTCRVIESKDPNYPVGRIIVCYAGWVKVGKINTSAMLDRVSK